MFWSVGCKNLLQKKPDVGTIKSWKLTKKFEISKQNSCAILLHRIDYILRFPPMVQVRISATKKKVLQLWASSISFIEKKKLKNLKFLDQIIFDAVPYCFKFKFEYERWFQIQTICKRWFQIIMFNLKIWVSKFRLWNKCYICMSVDAQMISLLNLWQYHLLQYQAACRIMALPFQWHPWRWKNFNILTHRG